MAETKDVSDALIDLQKQLAGISQDAPNDIEKIKASLDSFAQALGKFKESTEKNQMSDLRSMMGVGGAKVKQFSTQLGVLGKQIPQLAKASAALAGPVGLVIAGFITAGTVLYNFYANVQKTTIEMARLATTTGDFKNTAINTFIAIEEGASVLAFWGMSLKEVKQTMSEMASTGLRQGPATLKETLHGLNALKAGMGLTGATIAKTVKLLNQEYQIKDHVAERVANLTDGYETLRMTTNEYLETVTNLSQGFINFGISAESVSKVLVSAAEYGATRAQAYTREMIGGPRQAGRGERAWLAEKLNIGSGLGGAAKLAYGKNVEANLGEKTIDIAKKELGIGDISKMGEMDRWAAAEEIAMFMEKRAGVTERTTMEYIDKSLKKQGVTEGLDLKKPQDDMLNVSKDILDVSKDTADKIGQARDLLTNIADMTQAGLLVGQTLPAFLKLSEAEQQILMDSTRTQHSGGMVNWPRYHSGLAPDERRAILQTGEGVLSRQGVAAAGGASAVSALNQGSSGGNGGVTVNVSIPVLKQAIEEAVTRVMRETPSLVMF